MSNEVENKAIVGRWFKEFWGNPWNPSVVDELAIPDILLQYSLHAPRRGREDVKKFMVGLPRGVSGSQFLGRGGPHRRGRLRGRSLGRRWNAYWARVQRFFDRFAPRGDRPEDALHRNDRASP